ncbi:MAG TPA: hypothetical protein VMH32_19200 [Burkholderiales bacterium]|nr:hypothetical protein [Burkholderiales bacterium]
MLKSIVPCMVAVIMLCTSCAASTYYQVTDPGSGKVFYTQEIKRNGSAVEFRDAKTGGVVTLQSSEIVHITPQAYNQAVPPPQTTEKK